MANVANTVYGIVRNGVSLRDRLRMPVWMRNMFASKMVRQQKQMQERRQKQNNR